MNKRINKERILKISKGKKEATRKIKKLNKEREAREMVGSYQYQWPRFFYRAKSMILNADFQGK